MSNPRIEVDVVANVAGVASGVAAATSQLDKLGNAAQATAPKFDKLSKATSQYNAIGLDFARVIQDAPFGIIGVGNNITQLAGSFQVLKNQTGSTSAAIKQAFSSILSSGNAIVLGISVLTTAFTILQQKGFFKSEEAAKSLDETLKDYQETLTGVAASTLKGAQDAQKELAVLRSLELQATNTAISTDKRLAAVNELQKLYPEYFGNLSKEQILNGDVGDSYLKVAANLLAKAKAQAATNQIAENGIELLRIEAKLEDSKAQRLLKTSEAQAQLDKLIEKRQKEGFLTQGDLQRYDTLIKSINNANESLQEEKTLKDEIARINKENESLTTEITKQIEAGATFQKKGADANEDSKKALDAYSKSWDEYNLRQESANILAEKLNFTTKDYEKNIKSVLTAIPKEPIRLVSDDEALQAYNDELFKTQMAAYNAQLELMKTSDEAYKFNTRLDSLSGKEVKIKLDVEGFDPETAGPTPFEIFIDSLEYSLNKLPSIEERIAQFAFTTKELLQNNVTDAFVDLGYSIGEALASGGNVIKAVGESVLKSFGRFLGQFGEQLIAYGVSAIAFGKASLALSNPFTAIPAGGVAIAAGVALTAISGIIGSLGKKGPGGGGGGGSSVGTSGAGGGSSFTGLGSQGGMFASQRDLSGELVVRGQDLVYVFREASNRINKG